MTAIPFFAVIGVLEVWAIWGAAYALSFGLVSWGICLALAVSGHFDD